jgi:hypothetical protein
MTGKRWPASYKDGAIQYDMPVAVMPDGGKILFRAFSGHKTNPDLYSFRVANAGGLMQGFKPVLSQILIHQNSASGKAECRCLFFVDFFNYSHVRAGLIAGT